MNIGSLISMLRQDPALADDPAKFVAQLNEKNIEAVTEHAVVVKEKVVTMVSLADRNGGEATEANVQQALDIIAKDALIQAAEEKHAEVIAAIYSGEIATVEDIPSKDSK